MGQLTTTAVASVNIEPDSYTLAAPQKALRKGSEGSREEDREGRKEKGGGRGGGVT